MPHRLDVRIRGLLVLVAALGIADLSPAQQVELISRAALPAEAAGGGPPTSPPAVSDDGRFIVFASSAPNLVPGQIDTNNVEDVFLYDRVNGSMTLVSHGSSASVAGSAISSTPGISGDGNYVVFTSNATDLGAGFTDANGASDVFLYERASGGITVVSHTSSAVTTGNSYSRQPAISADGNWVVFISQATDLGPGFTDTNSNDDVFLFERASGQVRLASHTSSPTTSGNGFSTFPMISGDGSFVAFISGASDLGSGITDSNSSTDVYLYRRATDLISLVSHTSAPATVGNGTSTGAVISRDGTYVAFISTSTDLGPGFTDGNSTFDVFLYQTATGALTLASHGASATTTANDTSGVAAISDDAAYVALLSNATDLTPGVTDTNGTQDVFLYHRASGAIDLVTHTGSGTVAGNNYSYDVKINGDGSTLLVTSLSSDLGSGLLDSNSTSDVFWYDRASRTISLVSHAASPLVTGNQGSEVIALSADGAHLLFFSFATNLGGGFVDSPNTSDLFRFEKSTGSIDLVTRAAGNPSGSAAGTSMTLTFSSMSDDGRYALFTSAAANLVPGQVDTNNDVDVFLYDRSTGGVRLVSHASSSLVAGNGASAVAVISWDGNWVAFESQANDLGSGLNDVNSGSDVYLYERATETISVVSHTASPITTGTGFSFAPSISADGRAVTFHSTAPNLGTGFTDTNSMDDVFVFDRGSGSITLASHTSVSTTAGNGASRNPVMSGDGRYLVFESSASNLGSGISDGNSRQDVFLFEVASGAITLVSHTASLTTTANNHSYASALSFDAGRVLFESWASNVGGGITDTNSAFDLFLFEGSTRLITLVSHTAASATTAGNGASHTADLSADGSYVAFQSSATNLAAGMADTNSTFDAFLYDGSTGVVSLVSKSFSSAAAGNQLSNAPAISRDGRRVAFVSRATNLISGYSGASDAVFLHDRSSGSNVLVSHVPTSLATAGNGLSERAVIGLDGAHVAFSSFAPDLVDLDLNGNEDAFLFSFDCGGTSLNATPNGDNRIDLAWSAPGAYTYQILRSRASGGPYDTIGTVAGTSFVDATVQGGVTYYYVVTNACGPSNEASAATTGACQLPPDFAGAVSAMQQGGPTCQVRVDWAPATSPCGGSVSYSIYRDTTPGLVPGATNRIAAGLSSNSYLDAAGILPVATYYYVVRAMSNVNGEEEANLVEVSATPISCAPSAPAPVTFFNIRSGDSENVLDWVNPTGTFSQTHIAYTDDGSAPSCTGTPVPGSPFPGTAGDRGRVAMAGVNGTTYRYAACAEGPGTGLSAPVESFGRPDSTAGNWQWAYTTGAAALTVIGVIPDASYHVVSNDRILHALAPGGAGGSWPPLGPPDWFPFRTNAPVQGRPIVVNLPSTTVSGASRIALIGSQDGKVYAVDAETGAQLWASPLLGASVQAAPAAIFTDFGGLYDLVLVGTREPGGDSKFYGLHLASGAIAWTFDNGGGANGIGIVSGVAQVDYANHRVYFASRKKGGGSGDTLWCLSFTASTVNLEWSVDVGEVDGSPVLGGTRLYVGNNAGQVHAIDPADGDFLWLTPYFTGDGPVKGFVWPHVPSGRLYFSTTTKVHAIHDDGGSASAFWTTPVAIVSPSPVLLSRGRVYVGGDSSRLYSIDATSMTPTAPSSIVLGDPLVPKVVGAPVLDVLNGLMIAGSDLGVIFAVLVPF